MPDKQNLANAVRFLSMDAVEQAGSGHPGMPMGMADIATVLWRDFLQHNPQNPAWWNRDRFVLSNGHGSMLLYALLHLSGYDLSIEDLKNFRQLHSKTPGHPEVNETPGVETTTGPLGQGLANAVGIALAEKLVATQYNKPDITLLDHHTYAFVGDGCLMEGISHEACSLAGTWALGKLIVFWDDNGISIDGNVRGWFTDDTVARFRAYGWQVIATVDGHNTEEIRAAIENAQDNATQPTLICCKTRIGFGSPKKEGTASAHGAPLGEAEIAACREALSWPHAPFDIPRSISEAWNACEAGAAREQQWNVCWENYQIQYADAARELAQRMVGQLPDNFEGVMQKLVSDCNNSAMTTATRKASHACLQHFARHVPALIGGSADLTASNLTRWDEAVVVDESGVGNYIEYGVREFGMSAIMNGLALHGGFIPFSGTFLVFSDYARNAIRMSAIMRQKVIYVFTHDSIGLGEDGPTHQAVEQTASLRLIPDLSVWRPCDTVESAVAWGCAMQYQGPSALLFTRQNTACQVRSEQQLQAISKGAYILHEPDVVRAIVIATGSEVSIAMAAARELNDVRVVSMPCVEHFLQQTPAYQEQVLPAHLVKRVAIEAGATDGWYRFVGLQGVVIGVDQFGASAPGGELFDYFGINKAAVVKALRS
jgi:transketolase